MNRNELPLTLMLRNFVHFHNLGKSWEDAWQIADSREAKLDCWKQMDFYNTQALSYRSMLFDRFMQEQGFVKDSTGRFNEV